ncbi:MAG: DUF6134 family protein [Minwuia sp.]|uniref:DUF6134 family protein n=1 Tax=Minwuia sp. TaxID=2493630 RepID=UPI003A8A7A3C
MSDPDMNRRRLLTGSAALLGAAALSGTALARNNWTYDFRIIALGSDVGHHRIALSRDGEQLNVTIDIRLQIRVPLIGTFGYVQRVDEIWRGDQLLQMRAETDDDKRHDIVEAELNNDGKLATTSTRLGLKMLPGELWPASAIWRSDSADRDRFLDLTRGNIRPTDIRYLGKEIVSVLGRERTAHRWSVKSRRELEVLYGLDGEWLGLEWSEYGFSARYERVA